MATKDEDKRYDAAGNEVEYNEELDRYVPVDTNAAIQQQANKGVVQADAVQSVNENKKDTDK